MASKFFHGAELLAGDNTTPGLTVPPELEALLPQIFKAVKDFGCDYQKVVVQMLSYDEISEVASYGGFPVRYPHWRWGMEYEELQSGYEHGMHRIYEMVINTNPCYIYCLASNTLVDNITVVAHALGHSDFFKNNIFFSPTQGSQNMMNVLANHGAQIRKYMRRWGKEKVTEFIDYVLRIDTLIDPTKAWDVKKVKDVVIEDSRTHRHPERLEVSEDNSHMEDWINPPEWLAKQKEKIAREEAAKELGLLEKPIKDIFGFVRDNAILKPWQKDIIAMLYEESMYFTPQRSTKMLNEGWASYIDHQMMSKQGLCALGQPSDDCGIIEYAAHKMGVLGGKYSMNPYKIGFTLFMDIEERWDKGRFGKEYDECEDINVRKNWDKKLGLGHEKVLEVRKNYNDLTALLEFFTQEFCDKYEFYEWEHFPNGETKIKSRDYKRIRSILISKYANGGLPQIFLTEANYRGEGHLMLQHKWEGLTLYEPYVVGVLQGLRFLWGNDVHLASRDKDGEEIIYSAYGTDADDVEVATREEFDKMNKEADE